MWLHAAGTSPGCLATKAPTSDPSAYTRLKPSAAVGLARAPNGYVCGERDRRAGALVCGIRVHVCVCVCVAAIG